jgi:hypothetical protein
MPGADITGCGSDRSREIGFGENLAKRPSAAACPFPPFGLSAFQLFSISVCQPFSLSAFQLFSIAAFELVISAFRFANLCFE